MSADELITEYHDGTAERDWRAWGLDAIRLIESLREDERRIDWIIDNGLTVGGGRGFTLSVFIPVDSECLRGAIDEAQRMKP